MATSNFSLHDAQRQVERKIGFFIHLALYLIVNSGLLLFNLFHTPHRLWALGPVLGWGIGLLFHALAVFLNTPGARWKQRMVAREFNKHNNTPSA